MPPPTPTSTSPARIAWSSRTVARTPLAQTLLTVSLETSFGMPALICACRDDEAMRLLWDALPVLERELGPYHRDVAAALSDLAAIHHRRGDTAEEAVLLERLQVITHDLVLQPS